MIKVTPKTVRNVIFELWPNEEPAMIFVTEHNDVYMYCAYLSEYLPKHGYEMAYADDANLDKSTLKDAVRKIVADNRILG
jgi:hypothetical protein